MKRCEEDTAPAALWALVLAASLGVSLLLKSLIGIVFPVGAALVYLAVTRQFFQAKVWKRLHPLSGLGDRAADRRALAYSGHAAKSSLFRFHACTARRANITAFCGSISSMSSCCVS